MTIDPISAYAARSLASLEPVPALSLPLSLTTVGIADQARFQASLRAVQESSNAAPATTMAAPLEHPKAPGDVILHGLERLRERYQAVGAEMDAVANQPSIISPQELIALQMQVAQVTLGTQLVGQVASKLEQNLNTLLKGS